MNLYHRLCKHRPGRLPLVNRIHTELFLVQEKILLGELHAARALLLSSRGLLLGLVWAQALQELLRDPTPKGGLDFYIETQHPDATAWVYWRLAAESRVLRIRRVDTGPTGHHFHLQGDAYVYHRFLHPHQALTPTQSLYSLSHDED